MTQVLQTTDLDAAHALLCQQYTSLLMSTSDDRHMVDEVLNQRGDVVFVAQPDAPWGAVLDDMDVEFAFLEPQLLDDIAATAPGVRGPAAPTPNLAATDVDRRPAVPHQFTALARCSAAADQRRQQLNSRARRQLPRGGFGPCSKGGSMIGS